MSGKLKIGWSCKDFSTTEPTCIHGQFHIRLSKGITDPVTVTALVLDSGDDQMVWLSCDATGFHGTIVTEVRERVRVLVPEVDVAKLVMNCTHTHCTTDFNGEGMAKPLRDFPVDPEVKYMPSSQARELFLEACSQAVKEAWETRSEGGVAWGYGYAVASHSRKVWYFDDLSKRPGRGGATGMAVNGHAAMYGYTNDDQFSHYEAGADHFVNLMYTFDAAGTLTGAVVNLACPSQNSEGFESLTADFWHQVRQRLAEKHGPINVLAQCAPAGDLSPRILHYRAAQERRFKLKYGEFSTITERMDIAERLCGAFDEVLSWAKKDIRYEVKIVNSVEKIDLELRPCTDEEYKNEIAVQAELQKMEFRKDGTPWERFREDSILAARRNRSKAFLARCGRVRNGERYAMELHVVAVGDIAFVTSPFELYQDYMHRIQARSPYEQTFTVQLCDNQYETGSGYLATERAVEGGGYSSSRYCNWVSPKGGQELVEATLARLNDLKKKE